MYIFYVYLTIMAIRETVSESDIHKDSLKLCNNGSDVEYENYTSKVTVNCGCDEEDTCIRKCCQNGFSHYHDEDPDLEIFVSVCTKNDFTSFTVPIYEGDSKISDENGHFLVGMLDCNNKYWQYFELNNSDPDQKFYVQKNGSLYYPYYNKLYANDRYCVDDQNGLTAYLCFQPQIDQSESLVHMTAKLLAIPFLMATLIVYALLPERNLHRTALMQHVFCLIPGSALLAVNQFVVIEDDTLCYLSAYLILFFMISSFFWMNVICIDIWLAFSRLRNFYVQEKLRRRIFLVASLYAYGFPALNALTIFLIDTYGNKDSRYYPGIGKDSCFLFPGLPTIIYYFSPILILIVVNLISFLSTAINIQRTKAETKILQESRVKKRMDNDKFKLYWKLLFVMGLNPVVNTHVIQLISWAVGSGISHDTAIYIWYFKDFSHAAYGAVIFIIFVCQKKIWNSLKERFPCIISKSKNTDSKASATTSSGTSSTETGQQGIRLRGIQNLAADVP